MVNLETGKLTAMVYLKAEYQGINFSYKGYWKDN